jgi:hypothetical protein
MCIRKIPLDKHVRERRQQLRAPDRPLLASDIRVLPGCASSLLAVAGLLGDTEDRSSHQSGDMPHRGPKSELAGSLGSTPIGRAGAHGARRYVDDPEPGDMWEDAPWCWADRWDDRTPDRFHNCVRSIGVLRRLKGCGCLFDPRLRDESQGRPGAGNEVVLDSSEICAAIGAPPPTSR